MDELEKYECFGIPTHVWIDDNAVVTAPASGVNRRNWVHREAAMLGVEATPSPTVFELLPG